MKTAVLVREAGGIGDILCMDSPSQYLKSQGYSVHLVGMRSFEYVYEHLGFDSFEVVDATGMNSASCVRRNRINLVTVPDFLKPWPVFEPPEYLRRLIGGFDKVVDLFCPAWCYEVNHAATGLHKNRVEIFYEAAGGIGKPILPVWRFKKQDWFEFNQGLRSVCKPGYVVMHIRSTDLRRSWDVNKLEELVKKFPDTMFVEIDCCKRKTFVAPNYRSVFNQSLPQIACLLRDAKAFVGVESGMLHLAVAAGRQDLPKILLLGSNQPILTSTYDITPIIGKGDCTPCHIVGGKCGKNEICKLMANVSVDEVAAALKEVI